MSQIHQQAENLVLTFLQENPVSIVETIFIQSNVDFYESLNEKMTADCLDIDSKAKGFRKFFDSRTSAISKIPIKSTELNSAMKSSQDMDLSYIKNENLTYSDKIKVGLILSHSQDKIIPVIDYLLNNMDGEDVNAIDLIVKENKSLKAIINYCDALNSYALSVSDHTHLANELKKNTDEKEYREGCQKLHTKLKSIYDMINSPSIH